MTVYSLVEVGARFVFRLQLAGQQDADPLTVIGRAAWVKREGNHYQVGVEFVGLRAEDKERIEAWVHTAGDENTVV